jgi:hypothetical protein
VRRDGVYRTLVEHQLVRAGGAASN